jgi:membrane protease YdiL (CAAX protease family)
LSSGLPFQTLGWQAPGLVRDIAFGAVLGFGVALILPAITRVAIQLFGPQVYNPRLVMAIIPRTLREWVLVPLVLLPAVFLEELIFRSYLVGGFGILVSTIALAIAAPILFGVVHSAQGPLGIVAAAGLGFLLTGLFMVTSSLVAPFVAHYVINLTQLVWAVRDRDFRETIRRLSSQNANSGSHL